MPRPRNQLTTAPATLPTLATASTANGGYSPSSAATSTASDCIGRMVAARKAERKSER